jgi:hypothetical protein
LYGTGASFYWSAFHLDLAGAIRSKTSGQSLSNVKIFTILAGVLGPVVSAVFIVNSSFAALFIVVAVILACSTIPLLRHGDYKMGDPLPSIKDSLTVNEPRKAWMYGLYGVTESALDILWPVFLFLNYPNLISVGGIVSLTSLMLLVVIHFVGRFADRRPLQVYRVGILSSAPSWVIRLVWLTPGGLLVSNLLGTITASMVAITLDQSMYHEARTTPNAIAALLFRTYYAAIGRIGILIIAVITNSPTVLFLAVAVITLLQLATKPSHAR